MTLEASPTIKVVMVGALPLALQEPLFSALGFSQPESRNKTFYKKTHPIQNNHITLECHNTLGFSEKTPRKNYYTFARVFVLAFDVDDPDAFKHIQDLYAEIQEPIRGTTHFAIACVGFRRTAPQTETPFQNIMDFAEAKQLSTYRICSLDNPESIYNFLDHVAIAGLAQQGLEKPASLPLAKQCYEYLEQKKAEENFVSFCLVMTNANEPIKDFKLILFLVAKTMLGSWRSDDTINAVIDSIVSYAAENKPRTWKSGSRATLFKTNPRYIDNTPLLADPAPITPIPFGQSKRM